MNKKAHPLDTFAFCPRCSAGGFAVLDAKAKKCESCGFVYYFNPSAAVAAFIVNCRDEVLVSRRAFEPAQGTLDLPGGFTDCSESAEQALRREVAEETGLNITGERYLFSRPNIYPFSGFDVHTVDMFFECRVEGTPEVLAADDASELIWIAAKDLDPALFGLRSISEAVGIYKRIVL